MEDRVSAMDVVSGLPFEASFFAVFDGHGGTSTSDYLSKNYHTNLFSIMRRSSNIKDCIKLAITQTEASLVEDLRRDNSKSGSTAISCLIALGNIYTANLGDSRAVLSRRGVAIELSKDHKPGLPEEIARVVSVGGFVTRGRVLGSLAVSRAFGDIDFKSASSETCCVSPEADLMVSPITPDDEFLVLACDGLWDVMTSQQVVDYVSGAIRSYGDINRIATNLVEHAINTLGTTDNVSLIIVKLKMKQGDSGVGGITAQRSSSGTQQIASSFASGSTINHHDDFDDADDFSGSVLDDLLRETSDTVGVKTPLSISISRGPVVKDAGGASVAPPKKGAMKDDHDLDLEFLMNDENFK
jgi:serine/threonine protein phosphatase PrpC